MRACLWEDVYLENLAGLLVCFVWHFISLVIIIFSHGHVIFLPSGVFSLHGPQQYRTVVSQHYSPATLVCRWSQILNSYCVFVCLSVCAWVCAQYILPFICCTYIIHFSVWMCIFTLLCDFKFTIILCCLQQYIFLFCCSDVFSAWI